MLAVNVNSFRLCRARLPQMIKSRSGDIIVTSSIAGPSGSSRGKRGVLAHGLEARGAGLCHLTCARVAPEERSGAQ
jgi:NAD(P)-dependent dehydrogenase (short-subunit alcohol dehydrogenase family)